MKGYKRPRPDRGADAWELVAEAGRDPLSQRRKRVSRIHHGTERSAETALAHLVSDITRARVGPGADAKLTVLLDAWLKMVGDDLSPSTLHGYRGVIRTQITPALGNRPVSKITTPELDSFYRDLLTTRAPATVRQTHAILRRAFRQAVRWGWLLSNPAVDATPPRVRRKTLQIPTPEQVSAILSAAGEWQCLLRVAVVTGARRGEVCGLRWSRVDLEAGTVRIDTAVVEYDRVVTVKGTKTHQERIVSIDPGTVAALKAHRKVTGEACISAGASRVADPFVFSRDPAGERPVRPDAVTTAFHALAKTRAPGTRLHDLRHFAATRLLDAGTPVKTVSARLGHQSAAMTLDVYGHALTPADRAAGDFMGGLFA